MLAGKRALNVNFFLAGCRPRDQGRVPGRLPRVLRARVYGARQRLSRRRMLQERIKGDKYKTAKTTGFALKSLPSSRRTCLIRG
jgi:hypothetical protein